MGYEIGARFAHVDNSETNGQAEVSNKITLDVFKKWIWVEELLPDNGLTQAD